MDKALMEQRIVSSGTALCRERVERGGAPIRSEDLMQMKVKTFSLATQVAYSTVGVIIIVVGFFMYHQTGIMAMAMALVLLGIGNIVYAVHGRPKRVAELDGDFDMAALTSDIVGRFVREMDARPKVKK